MEQEGPNSFEHILELDVVSDVIPHVQQQNNAVYASHCSNILSNTSNQTLHDLSGESNVMTLVLNTDQIFDPETTVTSVNDIATSASNFIEKAISMEEGIGGIPPDIVIRVDSLPCKGNTELMKAGVGTSASIMVNTTGIEPVTRFVGIVNGFSGDTAKSSPSSPTFDNAENQEDKKGINKRQRSYSDSGDQLSAQERACLDEIERGSQLTPEDQELFEDLSKNKFDFNVCGGAGVSANVQTCLKKRANIGKNNLKGTNCKIIKTNVITNPSPVSSTFSGNIQVSKAFAVNRNSSVNSLKQMDPLESALLQSKIPVSVLNKSISSSCYQQLDTVSNTPICANATSVLGNTHLSTRDKYQQNQIMTIELGNNRTVAAPSLHSVETKDNPTVTQAQTIKQVVVHINGEEQVFDLSEIEGGQFTVQPITMVTSLDACQAQDQQLIPTLPSIDTAAQEQLVTSTLSGGNNTRLEFLSQNQIAVLPHGPMLHSGPAELTKALTVKKENHLQKNVSDCKIKYAQRKSETEKLFMCRECGATYDKPSKLKTHVMSKHTGDRPFKCTYNGCDWAFTAKYKQLRHEECHSKKLKGIKEYPCPIEGCNKRCTTVYNLNTHLKLHSQPLNEECHVCDMKFRTLKELDKHKRSHGDEFKTVKCPYEGCTKMFFSKVSMGSHLLTHTRSSHHPCTFTGCTKVFTQPCKLKSHLRTHTNEKPYKCTQCTWSFNNSSHLHRHLRTHTNERNYSCKLCDKKFLRPEHLKGHMISHTGERPFKCEVPGCGASFTAKSTMYIHLKKHRTLNKNSPALNLLQCPIEGCKDTFQDKVAFRKHIDEHYGKEPRVEQLTVEVSEMKAELEASGLQFINLNLPAGNINQFFVSPELAQSLFAASAGSMVEYGVASSEDAKQPITIPSSYDSDGSISPESSGGGSARTDYHSNHLLSVRAKKRRHILKQKAAQAGFDLISVQDIADQSKMVNARFEDNDDISGPIINPNEVMTSRAITIRDPETGAIYVQTQLLQDDPPNLEFESQGNLDCVGNTEFGNATTGRIIRDANLADSANTSTDFFHQPSQSVLTFQDFDRTLNSS